MVLKLRRVVTGHDANGKAVVLKDEICQNVASRRQGQEGCVVWTTDTSPADNTGDFDGGSRQTGTTMPNGTVFRIVRYEPGVTPRMHPPIRSITLLFSKAASSCSSTTGSRSRAARVTCWFSGGRFRFDRRQAG
jgi:hypothetical protein